MKPGLEEFREVVTGIRKPQFWAVSGVVVAPLADIFLAIGPPYPQKTWLITCIVELVIIITIFHFWFNKNRKFYNRKILISLIVLGIVFFSYLYLLNSYTCIHPKTTERYAKGFVVRDDVKVLIPTVISSAEDALVGIEYKAEEVWTKESITQVEFVLLFLWMAIFSSLSVFVGTFVIAQRQNQIVDNSDSELLLDIEPLEESETIMNKTFINAHALIIGVGADLPMTVTDAKGINDILIDPNRAAYDKNNVTLLTEQKADKQSILGAFDNLKSDDESTVIVYYSGHGGIDTTQDDTYFLVPFGFKRNDLKNTAISDSEFTEKIESIKAKKLLVFLDCCHAGGMTRDAILKDIEKDFIEKAAPPNLLNSLSTGSGKIIIASSHDAEYSIAANPYSIFTDCLIEAMSGKGTQRPDGYARILDILSYLFEQVPMRTKQKQHPFVNKIVNLSEDFPICYYAGGRKNLPNGKDSASIENFADFSLTQLKNNLIQRQQEWEFQNDLINRIRQQILHEVSVITKFQYERTLLIEQSKLNRLEAEIKEIETKI